TFAEFNFQIVSGGIIEDDEGRTVPIINMRSKILDNSTLDFLKQFPTFNKSLRFNDYNAILIIPNGVPFTPTNLTSTGGVQLLAGSAFKPSSNDSMFSFIKLNQTYIWKISNLDMNFYQRTTQLWETYDLRYAEIIEKPSILLKDGEEWELLNLVEQQLPMGARGSSLVPVGDNDGENGDYNKIITLIQIELPFLVDVSLLQLQADLNQLKNIVESWANSKSGLVSYEIDVESPFRESIQGYINFLGAFNIVLFFVAGILACVALFLLYYSLTLVEQRKSRLIAIMKNRGSSNNQIQTMLFAEAFTSAVIAISVGMILSIPWTSLTLQTSGILEFNAVRIPLSIPQSWYWRIPLIGMILSLDLNLASILSLSKTTIEEGGEAEEKKPPFWQKSYLDVILVSVSIIFWLVIRYIPIRSESMYGLLVEGFSPIMLIILIIGAPLIFARYFSAVISKIADFLWKFQGGIIALATKNMRKNKFSNARLASLLMIGIMLSFLSVITPATIELWGNENAYYDLGSDIYVQGLDSSNVTEWNKLNMPGVEGYTEIGKLTLVGGPFEQYSFLGIDPQNFDKVAFWKNDYDEKPLSSITSKITRNTSIGIQTKVRRALGLNLNQTLSIPVSTDVIRRIIVLDIVTEFEYFPDLVQTIPDEDAVDPEDLWKMGYGGLT
ncbi:MAG: FtsX-like permease family protein, partial [Candidatus Odinarchaeota archaeon]